MQILVEAIKKADSTDSDKVAKALLGLTVDTPIGKQTIRAKDHQANRGQFWGKTVKDPKYPFAVMKDSRLHRPGAVHGLRRRGRARRSRARSSEAIARRGRLGASATCRPRRRRHQCTMPEFSFLFGQFVGGLTAAMFLFLIASGLSLIFGVLRVLNFAHGSFYMIGAYLAWQLVRWIGAGAGGFWLAALGAALAVALLGGIVERVLLRHLYDREELYQLLFTYALVLILGDVAKVLWGTQQLRCRGRRALPAARALRRDHPALQPVHHAAGAGDRARLLVRAAAHRARPHASAPPRSTARRWARSAPTSAGSTPACSCAGSFLAGLGGALVTPIKSIVPGMDVEIIVEAFIVVVIGGLGSFWGTFLGALIYGQVLSFGILIFPRFSIFAVFAADGAVLIVRPWGLLGRPLEAMTTPLIASLDARSCFVAGAAVPFLGSRFYTFVATDIVILALFARASTCCSATPVSCRSATPPTSASAPIPARILMKNAGVPFLLALPRRRRHGRGSSPWSSASSACA